MAEKITLKNTLANLPQKTDVDSIVATDASGNPVYIKKADLAQVVAELIHFTFPTINGILSDVNLANSGIAHVNGDTMNNPAQDVGTCITFKSTAYMPQIIIKWDNTIFVRFDNKEDSKWVKLTGISL